MQPWLPQNKRHQVLLLGKKLSKYSALVCGSDLESCPSDLDNRVVAENDDVSAAFLIHLVE